MKKHPKEIIIVEEEEGEVEYTFTRGELFRWSSIMGGREPIFISNRQWEKIKRKAATNGTARSIQTDSTMRRETWL